MFIKISRTNSVKYFTGKYEFHISGKIREKYKLSEILFSINGNVIFENITEIRKFVQNVNYHRETQNKLTVGEVYGSGLLDEIFHFVIREYESTLNKNVFNKALNFLKSEIREINVNEILLEFVSLFPPKEVYSGKLSAIDYLNSYTKEKANTEIALEELMLLYFANFNPANKRLKEFFDEGYFSDKNKYLKVIEALNKFFLMQEKFGPDNQDIFTLFLTPIINHPDNLWDQLEFIRKRWAIILKDFLLNKILTSKDLMREETNFEFFGQGTPISVAPSYKGKISNADNLVLGKSLYKYALDAEKDVYEPENFTKDVHWMPQVVMIAKNTYVWLDQLSKKYGRQIKTLDQIPDEELDLLASWNFNALWLIGIWERSIASKRIKHILGNIDAVASAYSLYDYEIAHDLGGEYAYQNLNSRARQRGIRLASDMVPNHTGIYSKWTIEHPEYFIQTAVCPFPNYRFTGENLSHDPNVEIRIEDGYWSRSDAAVVFQRIDKRTNQVSYIYHGNDGTNMPWNDTAQINMLEGYVREAVIQKIFEVAKKFSIIRFDAAMTLAKRHFSRLWYPEPGKGGDIPSRAEHAMTKEEFDKKFPIEFWREVVDRINAEMPETLLLAEAFWLMEGYFVRSLGMHRVYNSAFMHMMMKEENEKYRDLITNTLEFEPEILKRYVNFMSNPDEETAIRQFGTDDKYFGVLTLMITLPGLPMFAHGQIEGYTEKYGMEYKRAYYNEFPKEWLIERHKFQTFPLMKKRYLFAEVNNFWFYDCIDSFGNINENVFAFTNSYANEKALVLYNNRFERAEGRIYLSTPKLIGGENNKQLNKISIIDALQIKSDEHVFYICIDEISKRKFIFHYNDFTNGFFVSLNGFEHKVFLGFMEVYDSDGIFKKLHEKYFGKGFDDLEYEVNVIRFEPIYNAFDSIFDNDDLDNLTKCLNDEISSEECKSAERTVNKIYFLCTLINSFSEYNITTNVITDNFKSNIHSVKIINSYINKKYTDEYPSQENYYKSFVTSKFSNYRENIFIFILLILYNLFQLEKDRNKFLFSLEKILQNALLKLGRGEVGVERETKLILALNEYIIELKNSLIKISSTNPVKGNIILVLEKIILKLIHLDDLKEFLLVNTYQEITYFSKERFEEFLSWITTIFLIMFINFKGIANLNENDLKNFITLMKDVNIDLREKSDLSRYELSKLIDSFLKQD